MASEEVADKVVEEELNGFEPGELPTVNESVGDNVVNVLEDILGEDAGLDDLQKELDDTASKKEGSQKGRKTQKATTRRKPDRKKTDSKGKSESGSASPTVEAKSNSESSANSKKNKGDTTDKKVDKVSETGDAKVEKSSKSKAATSSNGSKGNEKRDTPPKSTKAPKKLKKDSVERDKKENSSVDEKEALVKKVKELEKMVVGKPSSSPQSTLEGDSKGKKDKASKSAERKRKGSETHSKETKMKRARDSKGKDVKAKGDKDKDKDKEEIMEDGIVPAIGIKEEPLSESEDMRVVDDVDELSEHGSHITNNSSFSHSFSRSPSFTGSFTGTFSSLSSFTASNPSLAGDAPGVDELDDHKNFIDSLLKGARYFIVKSNNYENVTLSKAKGVWATPPANERKLNDAYRHSTNVILIFSVKESGRFQGFSRLASESRHDGVPIPWVLPPGFDRRILSGTFKVDWLNRKEVLFSQCANLRNPWNENKEVKICRDGQELEPSVGEVLCRMFEEDYLIDLSNVARHLKHRKRLGEYFPKHDHPPSQLKNREDVRSLRAGEQYGRMGFRGGGAGGDGGAPTGGRGVHIQRGNWRGGHHRGDFGGGFRGDRGRFGGRRGGFFRRDLSAGRQNHHRFEDHRGRGNTRPFNNRYDRPDRMNRFPHNRRSRSRTPQDYRHDDRESRDRRHKDKVKEFLKNDRTKFGVRKETLLHGSYTDYVREFQRQKQMRNSSYYAPNSGYHHHVSGGRSGQFDAKVAAEEFLRRSSRR